MSQSSFLALHLFDAISPGRLAALAAVYAAAYLVKGAIGVGSVTPTTLFGAMIIEPHEAVALALVANAFSQMQFVRAGVRDGEWAIARRILVPNFAFAALGVWIFGRIDSTLLTLLLGGMLGSLVLLDATGMLSRLAEKTDVSRPAVVLTLSAVSGLISGVTGAGGLLLIAIYLRVICPEKLRFRGTILLLSTLVVLWRTLVMVISGHVDLRVAAEGLLLLPFILIGGVAGTWIYGRISEVRFSRVLQGVILFGAGVLLFRGAKDVLGL